MATGGSTNSILHIPAMARQAGIDITPELFDRISREVPVISTIYPNPPTYTMVDFSNAGGLGAVLAELAEEGLINTDARGMFGTIADKIALSQNLNRDVIRPVSEPIYEQGGLAVLSGNIATESAIVKFSAVEREAWQFTGPAKVYDSQDDAWNAILRDEIVPGMWWSSAMRVRKVHLACPTWRPSWQRSWARGWELRLPSFRMGDFPGPQAVLPLVTYHLKLMKAEI